jgi:hypothetical protein
LLVNKQSSNHKAKQEMNTMESSTFGSEIV